MPQPRQRGTRLCRYPTVIQNHAPPAQVLGAAQQQEQNGKPLPTGQRDLLGCRAGFPYSIFLLTPQTLTRRLPARSLVQPPSSPVPPSPAFNTRTAERPGTPGLSSLTLSCGWSRAFSRDGTGHRFSPRRLFVRLIPALAHGEVHTVAYKPRC